MATAKVLLPSGIARYVQGFAAAISSSPQAVTAEQNESKFREEEIPLQAREKKAKPRVPKGSSPSSPFSTASSSPSASASSSPRSSWTLEKVKAFEARMLELIPQGLAAVERTKEHTEEWKAATSQVWEQKKREHRESAWRKKRWKKPLKLLRDKSFRRDPLLKRTVETLEIGLYHSTSPATLQELFRNRLLLGLQEMPEMIELVALQESVIDLPPGLVINPTARDLPLVHFTEKELWTWANHLGYEATIKVKLPQLEEPSIFVVDSELLCTNDLYRESIETRFKSQVWDPMVVDGIRKFENETKEQEKLLAQLRQQLEFARAKRRQLDPQ